VIILDDDEVHRLLTPATAVAAIRSVLAAPFSAPPRVRAEVAGGALIFTVGRIAGIGYGFRVYDTLPTTEADQLTVVYDDHSGRLVGAVTGTWLGAARTGAIGAVAVDLMASPDAATLGLVGTGTQAWSQLWAIRAVRELSEVRVFSRDPDRRAGFAARCRTELGLAAHAVPDARDAVADAGIVVLATTSGQPVIEADWVRPGAHVTTVGPKEVGRHECPVELAARAALVATDSLAQLDAYPHPYFLTDRSRIVALSEVEGRPDGTTLFCSVGLAGTELAVAAALFR
jgi:alanine dehydrogenase